jgi:hypothetical protein
VNLEATLDECKRLDLELGMTEEYRLTVHPKGRITPELRAALKEHKGAILCELMWGTYVAATGADLDNFPPTSPRLKDAYGDPEGFVGALTEYESIRERWDILKPLLGTPDGAAVLTMDGIIAVLPETWPSEADAEESAEQLADEPGLPPKPGPAPPRYNYWFGIPNDNVDDLPEIDA